MFRHVVLGCILLTNMNTVSGGYVNQESNTKKLPTACPALSSREEAEIRRIVYSGKITTAVVGLGSMNATDILVIPDSLKEPYSHKREATIALLLDIVRGGRPEDSLLAASYALALGVHPSTGRLICFWPTKDYDVVIGKNGLTMRIVLVGQISKLLVRQP